MADVLNILDRSPAAPVGALVRPTGVDATSYPRYVGGSNQAFLVSARQSFQAVYLDAGQVVNSISWVCHTTALSAATAQWSSLYTIDGTKLGVTADRTNTAWSAGALKQFDMSAPYTITASGLYLCGLTVVASTVPSLAGVSCHSTIVSRPPNLCTADLVNTSLTDPASAPATATLSATGFGFTVYCEVT